MQLISILGNVESVEMMALVTNGRKYTEIYGCNLKYFAALNKYDISFVLRFTEAFFYRR